MLELDPCYNETTIYGKCFFSAYYPNCIDPADPSMALANCTGLTNAVASHIAAAYTEQNGGEALKICNYTSQSLEEMYDCAILAFPDYDSFLALISNHTFQDNRIRSAFYIDEVSINKKWYTSDTKRTYDPVEGLTLPFTVYYNNTDDQQHPENVQYPAATTNMIQQALLHETWTRFMADNGRGFKSLDVDFRFQWGFYPSTEVYNTIIDTISTGAPIIMSVSVFFNYIVFSYLIIREKQMRLRQAMHIVGLPTSVFYFAHLVLQLLLAIVLTTICMAALYAFGFEFVQNANYLVVGACFFFYFLASGCMILLLIAFFPNLKIAVVFGLVVLMALIVGEVFQLQSLTDYFPTDTDDGGYDPRRTLRLLLQILWFPTNFAEALAQIGDFSVSKVDEDTSQPIEPPGFTFDMMWHQNVGAGEPYSDWYYPVAQQLGFMILNCVVYLLLAGWIDIMLPFAHGSYRPPWFFLQPSFWGLKQSIPPPSAAADYAPPLPLEDWDSDVLAEAEKLQRNWHERDDHGVIEIFDLKKKYFRHPPAVRQMFLSIPQDSVFGLLGPNGAGKTTLISMLTGSLHPTSGHASILGHHIVAERAKIAPSVGFAPQHDTLWPEISCLDHIKLFAKIKNIDPIAELIAINEAENAAELAGISTSRSRRSLSRASTSLDTSEEEVSPSSTHGSSHTRRVSSKAASTLYSGLGDSDSSDLPDTGGPAGTDSTGSRSSLLADYRQGARQELRDRLRIMKRDDVYNEMALARLEDVGLREAAAVPTHALSGGMRRRLTIALAMLGTPAVIFLDEPTTGLDPVSRRLVWDVIIRAKRGKSIILTTHSMEEADILSDRIGIMARGTMRCLGSSAHLKRRYGMGYRLDLETRYDVENEVNNVPLVHSEVIQPYMPHGRLIGRTGGHLTIALPRTLTPDQLETFLEFLDRMAREQPEVVCDWSLRQTTLEEVFLAVAMFAERRYEWRRSQEKRVEQMITSAL
eukprot:gnl/Chilomastix_cuspidata/963.p1 GENE.gnl/Chilomastix_cuspidata/963~~gnl/Chilomastix_cuspidata/963.p1  ORF type:complete len:1064 (-),score=269.88 gnl/Chilomastix_cuspidata/963:595-3528(-)